MGSNDRSCLNAPEKLVAQLTPEWVNRIFNPEPEPDGVYYIGEAECYGDRMVRHVVGGKLVASYRNVRCRDILDADFDTARKLLDEKLMFTILEREVKPNGNRMHQT